MRSHKFGIQQVKATAASVGIGMAVFALVAYALMLFSVTQNIALKGEPAAATTRAP